MCSSDLTASPATTVAPVTTAAPPTTAAPGTTVAPATTTVPASGSGSSASGPGGSTGSGQGNGSLASTGLSPWWPLGALGFGILGLVVVWGELVLRPIPALARWWGRYHPRHRRRS